LQYDLEHAFKKKRSEGTYCLMECSGTHTYLCCLVLF